LAGPLLSTNGRWLYVLNRTDGRLLRLDARTLRTTHSAAVPDGAAFTLAHDGKAVYVVAPREKAGVLLVLDPATLTECRSIPLTSAPYELAAGPNGRVFVSGDGNGWTDVTVVDTEAGTVTARWGGVWGRSFLALTPDG